MKDASSPERSDDPILTTRAAADILGVSVSTAQLWIEGGAIESWKTPGGHRRVRLSAVMKLLENRHNDAAAGESTPPPALTDSEFAPAADVAYPTDRHEAQRLQALANTRLVDSHPEQVFDRLTWLATQISGASMALVSLLTAKRQWFKSRVGVAAPETPRDWAFCSYAVLSDEPFIVEDATADARFKDNPLVTGEPYIRFYAGFPLSSRQGVRIGTLCVLDRQTHQLSSQQVQALRELASIASEEISRRG